MASPARLLIVDDSPTALSLLRFLFEGNHYEVQTATDGREGLAKALQWGPDLIVTDNVMPVMTGLEFLRHLKDDPATRDIPVIMLTGSDGGEQPNPGDPRPEAFASKSSDWATLLEVTRNLLQGRPSGAV